MTSAGAVEKVPVSGEVNAKIEAWSCGMERCAKKCAERNCELANKGIEQFFFSKAFTPCTGEHQFQKEELETVRELSKVRYRIVLQRLYLARIGTPDNLWSVNKLARAVTKWTRARDKRVASSISYIHNTSIFRQYGQGRNTSKECRFGPFSRFRFVG